MLILSRKSNEKIRLCTSQGEEILIEVVAIRGNRVQLGLSAPLDISIHREELLDRPFQSNGPSSRSDLTFRYGPRSFVST